MSATLQPVLAVLSGGWVGFTLGLIGEGGCIMATLLLLYVVGLQYDVAIGTCAFAVSANAFANLAGHARAGNVRWCGAAVFAVAGTASAAVGSWFGKGLDGTVRFIFQPAEEWGRGARHAGRRADRALSL